MKFFFRFIFIILFAVMVDILTVESLGYVVQDIFNIPDEEMSHFMYWDDTFISRIILSLLGTFIGGYIIGSFLTKKQKLAIFIYALPILIFWLVGVIGYYYISALPHNLDNPEFHMFSSKKLIPLITLIFTLPAAYLGNYYGALHNNNYTRAYSIINIKWYNLIWFIPTFYSFAIAVICMLFVSIFYSLWLGDNPLLSSFQMFSQNKFTIDIISLLSLSVILISSLRIIRSTYKYLSDEASKVRYKNLKIFGGTMYFCILFAFTFNLPHLIFFDFEVNSLIDNKIAKIPKNINEVLNFSLIMISGYIIQRPVISVLKTSRPIKTLFEIIGSYRLKLFNKIFK